MKHPFWIVNSALLFLFCTVLLFIYFSQYPLPERVHVELIPGRTPIVHEKSQINIAKLYEQDLFDTYKQEEKSIPEEIDIIEPVPVPPQPQPISIPEPPEPQFLEPVNITLKGIITISSDNGKNRTIIEDNKTKQETVYRVGDTIEDARLIRIFNSKIILLRTNGQQEVLYLREQDAKNDPAYLVTDRWDTVISKITDSEYAINTKQFISRISSLGQIIDTLGLTTAYDKGISKGCRIGQIDEKSFGPLIGLQKGDIIISINNIPADSTENRLAIYQHIIAIPNNGIISMEIERHNERHALHYTLQHATAEKITTKFVPSQEETKEKNISILHNKYSFAPTMKEIRAQERKRMLEKEKKEPSSSTHVGE